MHVFIEDLELSTGVYKEGIAHIRRRVHQLGTGRGEGETGRRGDERQGDAGTRGRGDAETGGHGDAEMQRESVLLTASQHQRFEYFFASLRLGGLAVSFFNDNESRRDEGLNRLVLFRVF